MIKIIPEALLRSLKYQYHQIWPFNYQGLFEDINFSTTKFNLVVIIEEKLGNQKYLSDVVFVVTMHLLLRYTVLGYLYCL